MKSADRLDVRLGAGTDRLDGLDRRGLIGVGVFQVLGNGALRAGRGGRAGRAHAEGQHGVGLPRGDDDHLGGGRIDGRLPLVVGDGAREDTVSLPGAERLVEFGGNDGALRQARGRACRSCRAGRSSRRGALRAGVGGTGCKHCHGRDRTTRQKSAAGDARNMGTLGSRSTHGVRLTLSS